MQVLTETDDLNMPLVDKYGTQQPIALLRQGVDYAAWYDRGKLTLKEVQNIQFLSCMNPTAGSFIIDPRLQRSYMTFSVFMPRTDVSPPLPLPCDFARGMR